MAKKLICFPFINGDLQDLNFLSMLKDDAFFTIDIDNLNRICIELNSKYAEVDDKYEQMTNCHKGIIKLISWAKKLNYYENKKVNLMKEILTMGDVSKDFNRLGIPLRMTYKGREYGVCEVTEDEFQILDKEEDSLTNNTWINCGWLYSPYGIENVPNKAIIVNNKSLLEWSRLSEESNKKNILVYWNISMMNLVFSVCAITKWLAIWNNIKLSELFNIYHKHDD